MSLKNKTLIPLSVDCVIFGYAKGTLQVALIERKKTPFIGKWAIPGGFLIDNETVEEAALRELREETGLYNIYLEQFHVFSHPNRDPRGRVITVAFFALISSEDLELIATEDAAKAAWWPIDSIPPLAFDHELIFHKALSSLQKAVSLRPLIFELLPKLFTLTELQILYEQIFGFKTDKRNFRKKILSAGIIKETKKTTKGAKHRPAQLYQYNNKEKSWEKSFHYL
jgi:8-oxo-dGTP diphosphatase